MNLEDLIESLPGYAKDLKLNYSTLVRQQTELTPQQLWGTLVVSAMVSRNQQLSRAVLEEALTHLSAQALEAAKAAAAIMGMNNVYYRFLHLTSNEKYRTLPAKLRMNVMRSHGVEQTDFELWSTAASAINGCGACVDSHEKVLRQHGLSEELVLMAVRIASVVHAIATVLDVENVTAAEAVSA